jgi:hypothetical protein
MSATAAKLPLSSRPTSDGSGSKAEVGIFHIAEVGDVAGGRFPVDPNRLADYQILITLVLCPYLDNPRKHGACPLGIELAQQSPPLVPPVLGSGSIAQDWPPARAHPSLRYSRQ